MSVVGQTAALMARLPLVRRGARRGWLPQRLQGRVRAIAARPHAPYRAVVLGVEPEAWAQVDIAFPEFAKLFARRSARAADIVEALDRPGDILVLGELAPPRLVADIAARAPCETVFLSRAPVPRLPNAAGEALGWSIDTLGHWRRSRRLTEMSWILAHFDFDARPGLLDSAEELLLRLAAPAPTHARVLVIAPDLAGPARRALVAQAGERLLAEAGALGRGEVSLFDAHHRKPWHDPQVEAEFDAALGACDCVVADNSPLAIRALLRGREVVVVGQPFYAGFGLTQDRTPVRRPRDLTLPMFAAGALLLASRYVAGGRLVDPAGRLERPDA